MSRRDVSQTTDHVYSIAVETPSGDWADVVAFTRDLLGMKIVTWQLRSGELGCSRLATVRLRVGGENDA